MMDLHREAKIGSVLDHLNLSELQHVSNMVMKRIYMIAPHAAAPAPVTAPVVAPTPEWNLSVPRTGPVVKTFRRGESVQFMNTLVRPAVLVTGLVKSVNQKTCTVIPDGTSRAFRVPPRLLWHRGDGPLDAAAMAPAAPAPVRPVASPAFRPTIEGAGVW